MDLTVLLICGIHRPFIRKSFHSIMRGSQSNRHHMPKTAGWAVETIVVSSDIARVSKYLFNIHPWDHIQYFSKTMI